METFKVLDHGYVKYVGHMGEDSTIIEAARMSTGRGFEGWEPHESCETCGRHFGDHSLEYWANECPNASTPSKVVNHKWVKKPGDAKLLDFMYRNRHSTPFEMCELAIEVQAPIVVFREWHRHRTQAYSEFSARYSQMPNLHYLPSPDRIQRQSATNRQGSAEPVAPNVAADILAQFEHEQSNVYNHYDALVTSGLAKEIARLNTPVSRYSKMRAKTDLRNWLGFLQLRMAPNAQWEIRQYANAVAEIVKQLWPRTWALFEEYDLYGVRLSRSEARALAETLPTHSDWLLAVRSRLQGKST